MTPLAARQMDADFVSRGRCVGWGDDAISRLRQAVCRWFGHNLWRGGSVTRPEDGSLDVYTCHCRRCFVWGYVRGDYVRTSGKS